MRGVHSAVDDIRRNVFTEVARLAYGEDDYNKVDMIPYKLSLIHILGRTAESFSRASSRRP